jgi:hypothetical protein
MVRPSGAVSSTGGAETTRSHTAGSVPVRRKNSSSVSAVARSLPSRALRVPSPVACDGSTTLSNTNRPTRSGNRFA